MSRFVTAAGWTFLGLNILFVPIALLIGDYWMAAQSAAYAFIIYMLISD